MVKCTEMSILDYLLQILQIGTQNAGVQGAG